MNVYLCDAGQLEEIAEYIDGWARYEWVRAFAFIAAPTRGKARRMMTWKYDMDFIDAVSIRKLVSVDGLPEGFIDGYGLEGELGLWEVVERKNLLAPLSESDEGETS